jgi:hypothetical protein
MLFSRHSREFITLVGGVAALWPFAVRAQQAAMLTDGKMLEQLACLVAGHLILQRKRADYWIAGVVIAALRYLGG